MCSINDTNCSNKGRSTSDFGLYRYYEMKRESGATKFVVIVTSVGIISFTVFYSCVFFIGGSASQPSKNVTVENNATLTTTPQPVSEKFLLSSLKNLLSPPKPPPSPFVNIVYGPRPTSFLPIPSPSNTYPQIKPYTSPTYPRNIQEIIGYITPDKKQAASNYIAFPSHKDPFHPYKPRNPSDVNLLATSNVRFAPPIWKDMHAASTQEVRRNKRPLTMVLNLYPNPQDPRREHYVGYAEDENGQRFGKGRKLRSMVIHLNVYADDGLDEERYLSEEDFYGFKDLFVQEGDAERRRRRKRCS